jgi:hypothetical protein
MSLDLSQPSIAKIDAVVRPGDYALRSQVLDEPIDISLVTVGVAHKHFPRHDGHPIS